ncbi:hypothetical protein FKM82_021444 [Ascaphus truei]
MGRERQQYGQLAWFELRRPYSRDRREPPVEAARCQSPYLNLWIPQSKTFCSSLPEEHCKLPLRCPSENRGDGAQPTLSLHRPRSISTKRGW